jgi:predicted ATPase
MTPPTSILFPPFRLELDGEQLWRDGDVVALRPKSFAVLRHLLENAGRLMTKDELLDTVWARTAVSDTVLKSCVRELRKALGDDVHAPRYIETVHGRGYRFRPAALSRPIFPGPRGQTGTVVGREGALGLLHAWLDESGRGERRLVFVTGEPGIGKTALVDAFLADLDNTGQLLVAQGQCIEQYGAGEPYLPIIEALSRLSRGHGAERLRELLERHAPTWLAQLPALLDGADLEALQRKVAGATPERRLREMAELLEALTVKQTLVLWLEDLHWSDASTIELLAMIARRRDAARLLVVASYRPTDVIVRSHPLREVKQELSLHGDCRELHLGLLSEDAVHQYLARRFDLGSVSGSLHELARAIHHRTDGNPLFMVSVVDDVLRRGGLAERDGVWSVQGSAEQVTSTVPDSLRHMIEWQLERLDAADRRVLEIASVAGVEFSAAAVAAGIEATVDEVEDRCTALARRGQLVCVRGAGECPDGTFTTHYAFVHALFQHVTYDGLPAGRQSQVHHRLGVWNETAYGSRAGEIATQLAVHFERGRDAARAIRYLHAAAENALRRGAHREAIAHLTRGIELLPMLPTDAQRAERELGLQITLGGAMSIHLGYAAPEVEAAYLRAHCLSEEVPKSPSLGFALVGLSSFRLNRGELSFARDLASWALDFARTIGDRTVAFEAHVLLGVIEFTRGALSAARDHETEAIALYAHEPLPFMLRFGSATGVSAFSTLALVLSYLGFAGQASALARKALALGEQSAHPFTLAFPLVQGAYMLECLRDSEACRAQAEAVLALSIEHGFPHRMAQATVMRGWALAEQGRFEEGIAEIRRGVATYQTVGAAVSRPYYLGLLAAAHERAGRAVDGLAVVNEALDLVRTMGGHYHYEPELVRLKGQLLSLVAEPTAVTEACFRDAIEIAGRQKSKMLELRATVSLCRLWRTQGRRDAARRTLAETCAWFTEGFDMPDLAEARALLADLDSASPLAGKPP